jgi:Spy/CpxP family protein refolding chaperone
MAALGRNLEGGTQMQPAMQNGPAALMGRAPDGPMALGGADALGRGGNLGGGGVLRPEVSERMKQFMQSGVGNAAAQGIKLTPAQAVALQQSDTTRLGALERATIGAESRLAQQGLRNDMNAMSATAKADAAAAKAEIDALKTGKKDATTAFDETKKLRDEFNAHPNTKSFDVVDNYFERGVKLAQKQTSAGDMGLIFALMKVYDPTSTVREGEYATAANSGSIPQQFLNIYNKTKDGQKLQPEQRAQFVETMAEAADVQHKKLMGTASQYNSIAQAAGLDPNKVVAPSYVSWKPPTISDKKTETQGTAPTGIDSILNKYPPRQGFGPR